MAEQAEDQTQVVDETTSTDQSTEQEQTASEQDSQVEPTDDGQQDSQDSDDGGDTTTDEGDEKQIPTQEERELSPRYQRKATKLAERLTEDRQKTADYMRELYKPAPRPQPYNPMPIEDGQTYSHEDLLKDRQMAQQQAFQDGASTADLKLMQFAEMQANERYADQLERESMRVERKHPELDPESGPDTYDHELREEIDSLFAETAYQSRESYEKFVERYFKGAERYAEKKASDASQVIARQASRKPTLGNSTTRSSSKLSREKIASMSDEEYVRRKPEIDKWVAEQSQ